MYNKGRYDKLKYLLEIGIFCVVIYFIHKEMKIYSIKDIKESLKAINSGYVILGIGIVIIDYFLLTMYDVLAFKNEKLQLSNLKIIFTSFISYAFANSIGLSGLTGSGLRINLYSLWNVPYKSIIKVIKFCYISFWVGLLWVGGLFLTFEPVDLTRFNFYFNTTREVGIILLIIAISYSSHKVFSKKKSLEISVFQILISLIDWVLVSGLIYIFLPHSDSLTFIKFFPIFLSAQIIGVLSNLPGGIGAFDYVFLTLMGKYYPPSVIVAALIIFRLLYYIAPFGIALVSYCIYRILLKKGELKNISLILGKFIISLIPLLISILIFAAGIVLIISGSMPPLIYRIKILKDILPVFTIKISHFLGSITGAVLLILAYGIKKRLNGAYYTTIIFLGAGIILSLLKGLDYEEAFFLVIILAIIIPLKKYFYRKTSIINEKFTLNWMVMIFLVAISSLYIGFFAYSKSDYMNEIWWKVAFNKEFPGFLRTTIGISATLIVFGIWKLFAPVNEIVETGSKDVSEKVKKCLCFSDNPEGNLVLLNDKKVIFEDEEESFVMYGKSGKSYIAMGDPVGKTEKAGDSIWKFYELCRKNNKQPVFYEVSKDYLDYYLDVGLNFLKIGEEGIIDLKEFTLNIPQRKNIRYTYNKLNKENMTFEVIPKGEGIKYMKRLREISDEWLESKKAKEKGFSLGYFDEEYLNNFPIAVLKKDDEIIAFANIMITESKKEAAVDLMRYLKSCISGTMEYLFIYIILWAKDEGYERFSLGMVPLSGMENRDIAPAWNKIGLFVFKNGESFYNFQGLKLFKSKFYPQWEPRYIAYSGVFSLPKVLKDVTLLISGGVKGLISK